MFIQRTHDRYAAVLGDRVGKQVRAIFTDEAKYNGAFPWTREMFSDFKRQFGYDLPPQLWRLFAPTSDPQTMLTRLHYRQWCGDRFRRAWLEPVSQWCREHKLALVGHISPEDDPVQQTQCVSNLFPCHTSFDVPGLDLIIPAVGDQRHPLINLGVLSAASAAQLPVLRVARELLESLGGLAGDGYRHVIRADRLRAHAADDLEVDPLAGGNRQQRFVARHDASLAVYPQTRSNPVGRVGIAPLGPDPRARLQAQVEAADNQPFTEVRRVIDVRVPRMLGAAGVRELQAPLPAGRRFIGDADAGVLLLAVGVRMVWRHPRRSVLESFIEHPVLYATMIQDLEKEFGVKRLPSVVGELGIDGEKAQGKILDLRKAQAAIADRTELKGKVCFVRTVVRDQRHTILP